MATAVCLVSLLFGCCGGGTAAHERNHNNVDDDGDDAIGPCADFQNRDGVPDAYHAELRVAAAECRRTSAAAAAAQPTMRLALLDCVLAHMHAAPQIPRWAECMSFLGPFVVDTAAASSSAESSASAAAQLLSPASSAKRAFDRDQRAAMDTAKHMLRNLTCMPGTVPASLPAETTKWVHRPDRTFSKLNAAHGLVREPLRVGVRLGRWRDGRCRRCRQSLVCSCGRSLARLLFGPHTRVNACARNSSSNNNTRHARAQVSQSQRFSVQVGYFTAGHDLLQGSMSIDAAESHCDADPSCIGFTFAHGLDPSALFADNNNDVPVVRRDQDFDMFFKRAGPVFSPNENWFAYVKNKEAKEKRQPPGFDAAATACTEGNEEAGVCDSSSNSGNNDNNRDAAAAAAAAGGGGGGGGGESSANSNDAAPTAAAAAGAAGVTYKVDVLRHDPLVAVVHDFATLEECEAMIAQATPGLTPARVGE